MSHNDHDVYIYHHAFPRFDDAYRSDALPDSKLYFNVFSHPLSSVVTLGLVPLSVLYTNHHGVLLNARSLDIM
jgi:hypothetical protein